MKKILVIDGNSILNRAFYGIRLLTTKDGRPTNAIYGMINIISHHLKELSPDYAAVAFDLKAPNFRKKRFSYYKEGRHETPPELLAQFDDAKECMRLLGLHTLELEGYEADDILGTLSTLACGEGYHAYVLSGDRDLLQLISPCVTVLLAATGDTVSYDRDTFFAKYGIEPEEFVDLKALMGDSSDHIYGVPGVGEKTAIRLIKDFHSVDGVYENIEDPSITKGLRAKLEAGKQSAYDSRWLATICREVPLGLSLEDIAYTGIDRGGLYEKCMSLELAQLVRKLGLSAADKQPLPQSKAQEASELSLAAPFRPASAQEILTAFPAGSSVALATDSVISLSDGKTHLLYEGTLSALAPLFDGSRSVIVYDGKRLLHRLLKEGIPMGCIPRDVMLLAYVLTGEGASDAMRLFVRYLDTCPAEGEPTAAHLLRLNKVLTEELAKEGHTALAEDIELPLSPVLARMEHAGFRLDIEALEHYGKKLAEEIVLLSENIIALAGIEFNINSPKQLAEVLFEHLGLPTKGVKKNKNGYSTDVDTLEALRRHHPIVDEILAYRKYTKLYSTYVVGLLKVADKNGVVHTEFKQALTATGRLSSAEPNLQNIPIRTALGRELRRVFIPKKEGYVLVDADYSQIELRLLAAFSEDESMSAAFIGGGDVHAKTAAAVFRVPESCVTDTLRSRAKAVNFGIVYGISAFSLSGDIGVSVAEAKRYMDSYFAEYPGIRDYLDRVVAEAEQKGYTETCFGRRRYIPELSSKIFAQRAFGKRVAMNSPIQGSAADIIKVAMVRVDRRLSEEGLDAHLVMQVHDELIAEARADIAERVRAILKEEMENAAALSVPLTVSTAIGINWLEAEH